ncbi:MAG: host attachment protein [Proteobacteria bacterium]|nr:host attachment protein [Pseudomonadota bacterium]
MDRLRKRALIVVADSARARFLEPGQDTRKPTSRLDLLSPASRRLIRALVTDKPGRRFRTAGDRMRHAYAQAHDLRKLEKRRFIELVAAMLDRSASAASSTDWCSCCRAAAWVKCVHFCHGACAGWSHTKFRKI